MTTYVLTSCHSSNYSTLFSKLRVLSFLIFFLCSCSCVLCLFSVFGIVRFLLFRVFFSFCTWLILSYFVQVYRPLPPGGNPIVIHIISYRIISYHMIYHVIYIVLYIISYRIIYNIWYHIVSYHIISYIIYHMATNRILQQTLQKSSTWNLKMSVHRCGRWYVVTDEGTDVTFT
jgi:hypothetical protein